VYGYHVDNPVAQIDDYRMEVLIRLPQLDILDKEDFTPDDKLDALAAYDERKEEFDQEDAEVQVLIYVYYHNTQLLLLLLLLRLFVMRKIPSRRPQMRCPAVRKCSCLYTMYHINNVFSCVLKGVRDYSQTFATQWASCSTQKVRKQQSFYLRTILGMSEFCSSARAELCAELANVRRICRRAQKATQKIVKFCRYCSTILLLVRH